MKTYCETFNHYLYHPLDTQILCERRADRLPECRRCRGVNLNKGSTAEGKASPQTKELITVDVDKDKWLDGIRMIAEEYNIRQGGKKDATAARRIALLVGEFFLTEFGGENFWSRKGELSSIRVFEVPIIEKDIYELAMECRLQCDPLERESKIKDPNYRKQSLNVWGVDTTSGVEGYTTELKEWARQIFEKEVSAADGTIREEQPGSTDFGGRPIEEFRLEEIGIGSA